MLTETWLYSDISDSELEFDDFSVFRCDRCPETSTYKRGGGVLIAVDKRFSAVQIQPPVNHLEQLFVIVSFKGSKILLSNVYIPPQSSVENYEAYCQSIEEVLSKNSCDKICLCGDFNLPDIKWQSDHMGVSALSGTSSQASVIVDFMAYLNLFQINNIPNVLGSMLDLVFCDSQNVNVNICNNPLLLCDKYHPALLFNIDIFEITNDFMRFDYEYLNFRHANYVELNNFLGSFDWDSVLNLDNVETAVERFYCIINSGVEMYVPKNRCKNKKFPCWYSNELKLVILNKKRLHKLWKETHNIELYREFCDLRSQSKVLIKQCYDNYIDNVQSNIVNDSKMFWKFVNVKNRNYDFPNCISSNDVTTNNPLEIVQFFADHFGSVYNKVNCDKPKVQFNRTLDIGNCDITVMDVFNSIENININLSAGPDKLPVQVLKNCKFILSYILTKLFNLSLSSGTFPSQWKTSHVTPVFKNGDKSLVNNYRPISKFCIVSKLFESIVSNKIAPFIYGVVSTSQHGFIKGRSTVTNLLVYTESLSEALEDRCQVDSVYTDFSKAFDRVQHEILLHKLECIGFYGPILSWFKSYLSNRTQVVKIKNMVSSEINVKSGVPQGSHLAPLFFDIFIDDLVTKIEFSCKLFFADDLKLFMNIKNTDDCFKLQKDLDRLCVWCNSNGMELNVAKCKILTVSRKKQNILFNYKICDEELERVSVMKDLGVFIDSELRFDYHMNFIRNKAIKMLGFVNRTLTDFRDIRCFKTLYCSYVRSGLEYASPIWSPYYNTYIDSLEKVQRRFLRTINFKLGIPLDKIDYEYLYKELNLPLLEVRRTQFDILTLFKIINGMLDCPELLNRINIRVPQRLTRQHDLFAINFHRTNYGINSPISRMCGLANSNCSIHDIFCDSLPRFRRLLTVAS